MMSISIQNKNNQENFYEKFEKNLNNPNARFWSGGAAGLAGTGSAFWLINYLLTNKNYSQIKERIVDGVKLSVADQNWIRDNMIFFEYKFPFCWYIGFNWFLSCPDIRRKKNTKSKKINKLLEIINNFFKDKCNDDFCRIKQLDFEHPVLPDRLENKKIGSGFVWMSDAFDGETLCEILDIYLSDWGLGDKQEFEQELKKENPENLYFEEDLKFKKNTLVESQVNFLKDRNYYPTFFYVDAAGYKIPHLCACFVVYDKNKEIKFFLWADSCANNQFLVLSKQAGLKKLKKQNKIWGKYTRGDIVEKYYVPELMQFEYAL